MYSVSSVTSLAGFAMIVLALALLARGPAQMRQHGSVPLLTAASQAAVSGVPGEECADADGERVDGPFGLTFCRGWVRTRVLSEEVPQVGALIVFVPPQSEAAAAGFVAGDVIYRVAGDRVSGSADAIERMKSLPPNQMSVVNFWRDGMPFLMRLQPGTVQP